MAVGVVGEDSNAVAAAVSVVDASVPVVTGGPSICHDLLPAVLNLELFTIGIIETGVDVKLSRRAGPLLECVRTLRVVNSPCSCTLGTTLRNDSAASCLENDTVCSGAFWVGGDTGRYVFEYHLTEDLSSTSNKEQTDNLQVKRAGWNWEETSSTTTNAERNREDTKRPPAVTRDSAGLPHRAAGHPVRYL